MRYAEQFLLRVRTWTKRVPPSLRTDFAQQAIALASTALLVMIFPAGLFLLLPFPGYRRALGSAIERASQERQAWLWLLALGPALAIAVAHPSPPDDLLRNLRAWRTGFDYRPMFWGSPGVQAGDYYLGFDWVIGWIDRAMTSLGVPDWSWLPVVVIDALGWSVALTLILHKRIKDKGALAWTVFVVVVLLVWLTPNFTARVLSGRPESFFALWAFCALAVEGITGVIAWTIAGMLLSTWYWFYWIYAPAALLLLAHEGATFRAMRWRIGAGLAVVLVGLAFWLSVSHGDYLGWFVHLREALHNRIASVGENEGLIMGLATPAAMGLAAIGLVVASARDGAVLRASEKYTLVILALLAAWYASPNMTRYTVSVVSLAAAAVVVLAAARLATQDISKPWSVGAAFGAVGLFLWAALVLGAGTRDLQDLSIPGAKPGQKVLTWFSRSTYNAVYLNPDLRIAPAFEVGFSARDVQQQSLNLGHGKVDCVWLGKNKVNWVIAPPARIDAAQWGQCLALVKTDKDGTSVWRFGR